jgi:hypothetical protein
MISIKQNRLFVYRPPSPSQGIGVYFSVGRGHDILNNQDFMEGKVLK